MSASWKQLLSQVLLLLVSCRHVNTKTPSPTAPALAPLPTNVSSVVLKGKSHTENIQLLNPVNLTLVCIWTGHQNTAPNITGHWRKDGEEIQSSRRSVQVDSQQYNMTRVFSIDKEENLGNYSCVFGDEAKIDFILAAPQFDEDRDKPIISYVGDSVGLTCKMANPDPNTWTWYKENGTAKELISAEPQRYEIKNTNNHTKLLVHNLTEADSGVFFCGAVFAIHTTMRPVELKVITFMEPLKPFISILVEVVVLVAAILLFERCQSKKKVPAGDGTTADQKNMLPQGDDNASEGSSSMRQRKV
ncbi:embigin [Stegastes partitus]|uniref:Embigin n=1 Tax=Stegastes partitus TaxID=144197 RepID=A0A3B5A9P5_9TELE|nr:PREDICTED: embigin [Stegastes partitus]